MSSAARRSSVVGFEMMNGHEVRMAILDIACAWRQPLAAPCTEASQELSLYGMAERRCDRSRLPRRGVPRHDSVMIRSAFDEPR